MKNKILMITGGTGSFGETVLKKFINKGFAEIRIFSRDELKQDILKSKYKHSSINYILGDIRDENSICKAMKGVNFIFHAAALKQVPSCEDNPMEAFKTNVIGTNNVITSIIKNQVDKSIFLSTDKAVYPINTMGISKAMMEKLVISSATNNVINHQKKIMCITRYGNVLSSRGSVIPLFIEKILNNQPLTITDKKMTRFLMSLDEAVNLVMTAFNKGERGDLFIQKCPSANIVDLAQALVEIFNSKSDLKIIGQRKGEKIHETLCTANEFKIAQKFKNYLKIPFLNKINSKKLKNHTNQHISDFSSNNTKLLNIKEIKKILMKDEYLNKFLR